LFRVAKTLVTVGLALGPAAGGRAWKRTAQNLGSVCYLAGGLAFRVAWIQAGRMSAHDDEAVALMARGRLTSDERLRAGIEQRALSDDRQPLRGGGVRKAVRLWTHTIGEASLTVEQWLRTSRRPGWRITGRRRRRD
jgi:hypothetical protein